MYEACDEDWKNFEEFGGYLFSSNDKLSKKSKWFYIKFGYLKKTMKHLVFLTNQKCNSLRQKSS